MTRLVVAKRIAKAFKQHFGASYAQRCAENSVSLLLLTAFMGISLRSSISNKPIIVIAGDQVTNLGDP